MPEATMDEHHSVVPREYDIGSAGQSGTMKAEPQPQSVKGAPNGDFGLRVLTADARHHPTSRRPVDDICHVSWLLRAPERAVRGGPDASHR